VAGETNVETNLDGGGDGRVDVRAYAELNELLPPHLRGTTVSRPFRSHQTVKDIVEALGVPHTEIELILADGEPVPFSHRPTDGARLAVYPQFTSLDIAPVATLHPPRPDPPRFVVDVNLGRLARLLRLLGFDVRYDRHLDDDEIAAMSDDDRIVVTRDRRLLTRRRVRHGVFVHADRPVDQIVEVVRRLQLGPQLAPFTRCLRCGGALATASKRDVLDQLEPLTRRHYDDFARCQECGHVYWRGSHHHRLQQLVETIVSVTAHGAPDQGRLSRSTP
jgi:uncharacterized protein with PIN domain